MKKVILLLVLIISIPVFIVSHEEKTKELIKTKYGSINNKVIRVKEIETGNIIKVPIEEYVIGVVAGEMPASFNDEALKAQAVASRTYAFKRTINNTGNFDVTNDTQNQVYINENKMKEKWKNNYEKYKEKITNAVLSTRGEVILYNNDLIDALFFSTSNGYTENSSDVFKSNLPYLVSVESNWDQKESPVFNSMNEVTKNEFLFNLGLNINDSINITNIEKTKTGRIKKITINDKTFDSQKIKNIFNLKSTSFRIEVLNDNVKFLVNGYGHGVGMSQYGANGMAKEGYKYTSILQHYYQNCEIKKIN